MWHPRNARFLVVAGMAAVGLVLGTGNALAASRADTGTFSFEKTFVIQPGDPASCSFPVYVDLQVHGSFRVLLDAQGQPTSVIAHDIWSGTLTANGKSDVEHAAQTDIIDLVSGAVTNAGSIHDQAFGNGVVIHDVGLLRFDAEGNLTFEAGPHQGFSGDPGAIAALCASLT
jgi:hypothetical protein